MQDTSEFLCPYCGQVNEIYVDFSGGEQQSYIEDCQVCCQPLEIQVVLSEDEPHVSVRPSNE
ncbi:CPXCG motif-containing cysteine-rich protein [candidate division KSB1 bacterium]|nr:CPXCG motif-containing cysteine-rich protein [candidate division KSB1 bacterium]